MTSSYNETDLETMSRESRQLLATRLTTSILHVSMGALGLACNLLILMVVLTQQRLRSSFYTSVLHVAIAELLLAGTTFGIGTKRIVLVLTDQSEVSTIFRCMIDLGTLVFAQDACCAQTICLSFDRLVAAAFPVFYRNVFSHGGRTQLINCAMWSIPFAFWVVSLANVWNDYRLAPVCTFVATYTRADVSFNPVGINGSSFFHIVGIALVIFMHIMIVAIVQVRRRRDRCRGRRPDGRESNSLKVTKAAFLVAGLYTFTWLLTVILQSIVARRLSPEQKVYARAYFLLIRTISTTRSLIIYACCSEEFRRALLELCCPNVVRRRSRAIALGMKRRETEENHNVIRNGSTEHAEAGGDVKDDSETAPLGVDSKINESYDTH